MADSKNENKIKHLEFIQLAILRMNVNSFMIKGWSITLVAAIFILSQKDTNSKFLWYIPFVTILFWALDAFYLSTERKYISLYNEVRKKDENEIDYSMSIKDFEGGRNGFIMCLLSLTLIIFYPIVIIASLIASSLVNQ